MTTESLNPAALDDAPIERDLSSTSKGGGYSDDLTAEELAYFNSRGAEVPASLLSDTPPPAPRAPVTPDSGPLLNTTPHPATNEVPLAVTAPRAPVTPDGTPPVAAPPPVAPEAPVAPSDPNVATSVDLDDLTVDSEGRMRNGRGQFVPHSALHEARERFKAERSARENATKELEDFKNKYSSLEGRISTLQELLTKGPAAAVTEPAAPAAPVEEPAPDPETDIFGYVKWQAKQIEKLSNKLTETTQQTTQKAEQVQQQLTESQMISSYKADAQSFAATKPEFGQAYRHLIDSRRGELALMGYTDPVERDRVIAQEEKELVKQAFTLRRRPAEFIYEVAAIRGFRPTPAAAPAPAATPAPVAPAPAAVAPVAATAPVPAAPLAPGAVNHAQQLANAAAAQAAAVTLSGAGGAPGEGLNLETIANMSETEFEKLSHQLGKAKMRELMGGRM